MSSIQQLVVVPSDPIGIINPQIHGHFAEHLGELIYPGIYVGPDSEIPNTGGIRNDVVEALAPLNIPVLRWPGGCFADTYHWQDGVGAREQRPSRVNVHWGMAIEPNSFGTHEFMDLCQALGTEPYFAANLGSASPGETRDWIEYCNFAGRSDLADQRRKNGAEQPFAIRYWGIGNENWGCGGNMSPEQYASEFARYRSFAFSYPETNIEAIACGPNDTNWNWTSTFFETLKRRNTLHMVQGFAGHYYCGSAGTATEYTDSQWVELLAKAAAVDGLVSGHRAIMDEYDPDRKIKLIFDEWGTWHPVEKGKPAGGLYQQNTIRDACVAALSLDVFQNHADKVSMTNIAQMINVLQALLLVEGDHVVKTPTYHVFDLYQPHKGGQAIRLINSSETISDGEESAENCRKCYRNGEEFGLKFVQGSASIKNQVLCVTLVNSHPDNSAETKISLEQGVMESAEVVMLAADNIHDHNTFDRPDTVRLSDATVMQSPGRELTLELPPASITRILAPIR